MIWTYESEKNEDVTVITQKLTFMYMKQNTRKIQKYKNTKMQKYKIQKNQCKLLCRRIYSIIKLYPKAYCP